MDLQIAAIEEVEAANERFVMALRANAGALRR
jgi:hypothetical protein